MSEDEDIWSLENLKNLIDIKIERRQKTSKRKDFVDAQFVVGELGGDLLDASWVGTQKLMMFGQQVVKKKLNCILLPDLYSCDKK